MDDFLTKLYHEETEKVASTDAAQIMAQLERDELEEYLGLNKVAVAGPSHPELPTSAQGAELSAKQKANSERVNKEHLSSVPDRGDGADPTVSFQGDGKEPPTDSPDEALQTSKQAMSWADQVGRTLARAHVEELEKQGFVLPGAIGYLSQGDPQATPKSGFWRGAGLGTLGGVAGFGAGRALGSPAAASLGALAGTVGGGYLGGKSARLSPEERKTFLRHKAEMAQAKAKESAAEDEAGDERPPEGMEKEDEFTTPEQKSKARALAATMKMGRGKPAPARKAAVSNAAGMLQKASTGDMGADDMAGMETTAAAKAKLAMQSLQIVRDAPEHIKQAAAVFAGRQMAAINGRP